MLVVSFIRRIKLAKSRLFCTQLVASNNSAVHQYFKALISEYEQLGSFHSLQKIKKESDKELYNLLKQYHETQDNLVGLCELKTGINFSVV